MDTSSRSAEPSEQGLRRANAARAARHRARQAAAGLTQGFVPVELLAEVKSAGGWEAWRAARPSRVAAQPLPAVDSAAPQLTAEQNRLVRLGLRVESTHGWRGRVVRWLLAPEPSGPRPTRKD